MFKLRYIRSFTYKLILRCSDFDKVVSHLNNLKTEVEDLKDSWDAFDECSLKSPVSFLHEM